MDALAITSIPLPHLKLMVAQDYAHSILDPRRPLAIPLRVYCGRRATRSAPKPRLPLHSAAAPSHLSPQMTAKADAPSSQMSRG